MATPALTKVCFRHLSATEYSQPCLPSACLAQPSPPLQASRKRAALKQSQPPLEGDTAQRLPQLLGTSFSKTKLQAGAGRH